MFVFKWFMISVGIILLGGGVYLATFGGFALALLDKLLED